MLVGGWEVGEPLQPVEKREGITQRATKHDLYGLGTKTRGYKNSIIIQQDTSLLVDGVSCVVCLPRKVNNEAAP